MVFDVFYTMEPTTSISNVQQEPTISTLNLTKATLPVNYVKSVNWPRGTLHVSHLGIFLCIFASPMDVTSHMRKTH